VTRHARAAAIAAAVCAALCAMPGRAAAQHEHHGVPAGSAQVVLTGTAHGAEGAPLRGAIVRLFHDPGAHSMATSVTDAAGRFVVRTGGGTYTVEISYPGHAPHRRQVTLATAPLDVGTVRLAFRAMELDAVTASAERVAVELRSGATIVNARASAPAGGSIADLLRTVPGVELDADGRIGMRGSTGVLVLTNGRRTALTGDALVRSSARCRQRRWSASRRAPARPRGRARTAPPAW
jgi:hypothetical protein